MNAIVSYLVSQLSMTGSDTRSYLCEIIAEPPTTRCWPCMIDNYGEYEVFGSYDGVQELEAAARRLLAVGYTQPEYALSKRGPWEPLPGRFRPEHFPLHDMGI